MKFKLLQYLLNNKIEGEKWIQINDKLIELCHNENLEDIKNLLRKMQTDGQITVSGNLYQLNSTSVGIKYDLYNVQILAHIRPQGEEDLENYLEQKKAKEPTIKIGDGFTGAIVTGEAKDIVQDFSHALINPQIQMTKKSPIKKAKRTSLLEKLYWTAGIILCLIGLYEFILKRVFHIPLP